MKQESISALKNARNAKKAVMNAKDISTQIAFCALKGISFMKEGVNNVEKYEG